MKITAKIAKRVLEVVDAGLVNGLGIREPGKMCVEAAVSYALDLPHGDNPSCVAPILRSLKIRLNDSNWSSPQARARGLRRLAVAQLGSAGALDEKEFRLRIIDYALGVSCPQALKIAASVQKNAEYKAALIAAAIRCEKERSREAALEANKIANAADAHADADAAVYAAAAATSYAAAANAAAAAANAAYAAYAAADAAAYAAAYAYAYAYAYADTARDKSLAEYAEAVVQILIEMKAPGCRWLKLTEAI